MSQKIRIGYDAKRLFRNNSGLGNYSRNLYQHCKSVYPNNNYQLYVHPRHYKSSASIQESDIVRGHSLVPPIWRSHLIGKDISKHQPDIFHGLSGELPIGLNKSKFKTKFVVTIHDLIFERHPEWYSAINRRIYSFKAKKACEMADAIICVSEQTKQDVVELYDIKDKRIEVIPPICTFKKPSAKSIRKPYLLFVGGLSRRKNLTSVIQSLNLLKGLNVDLLLVGTPRLTYEKFFFEGEHIDAFDNVHFLEDIDNKQLSELYSNAIALVYPSLYEGFGMPIIEAMQCECPVITTNYGAMKEVAGNAAILVDPNNDKEISEAIQQLLKQPALRNDLIQKGLKRSEYFSAQKSTNRLMDFYKQIIL